MLVLNIASITFRVVFYLRILEILFQWIGNQEKGSEGCHSMLCKCQLCTTGPQQNRRWEVYSVGIADDGMQV